MRWLLIALLSLLFFLPVKPPKPSAVPIVAAVPLPDPSSEPVTKADLKAFEARQAERQATLAQQQLAKVNETNSTTFKNLFPLGYALFTLGPKTEVWQTEKRPSEGPHFVWTSVSMQSRGDKLLIRLPAIFSHPFGVISGNAVRLPNVIGAMAILHIDTKDSPMAIMNVINGKVPPPPVRGVTFGRNPDITLETRIVADGSFSRIVVVGLRPFTM